MQNQKQCSTGQQAEGRLQVVRLMRQRRALFMHEVTVRRCQVGAYCRTLCIKRDLR